VIDKEHILAEIKRTANDNGGMPLGRDRFFAATGIRENDWLGRYWARWSDALVDAGYSPNQLQGAYEEHFLMEKLVALVREFQRFPARTEIQLRSRTDPSLPNAKTFERLGSKSVRVSKLLEYCESRTGYEDVLMICAPLRESAAQGRESSRPSRDQVLGHIYLLKSGRYYKIGRSNAVGRRERELQIQLPERANIVHTIATDDPAGIEEYWHRRFANKRKNGEWFELHVDDIAAFKRRRFM
jgi:hypothetical protein